MVDTHGIELDEPQGEANSFKEDARGWLLVPSITDSMLHKVSQYIASCDAVAESVGAAPESLMQYADKMADAREALKMRRKGKQSTPMMTGDYMEPWFFKFFGGFAYHRVASLLAASVQGT